MKQLSKQELELELVQAKEDVRYLAQVVAQLEKDCNLTGIDFEINLASGIAYDTVFAQVEEGVLVLFERDFHQLSTLLYSIDIPEEASTAAFESNVPSEEITRLILEREMIKVILRNFYKAYTDSMLPSSLEKPLQ